MNTDAAFDSGFATESEEAGQQHEEHRNIEQLLDENRPQCAPRTDRFTFYDQEAADQLAEAARQERVEQVTQVGCRVGLGQTHPVLGEEEQLPTPGAQENVE